MATYFEDNNFNNVNATQVYFGDLALSTFLTDSGYTEPYAYMNGTYTYAGNLKFTKQ